MSSCEYVRRYDWEPGVQHICGWAECQRLLRYENRSAVPECIDPVFAKFGHRSHILVYDFEGLSRSIIGNHVHNRQFTVNFRCAFPFFISLVLLRTSRKLERPEDWNNRKTILTEKPYWLGQLERPEWSLPQYSVETRKAVKDADPNFQRE